MVLYCDKHRLEVAGVVPANVPTKPLCGPSVSKRSKEPKVDEHLEIFIGNPRKLFVNPLLLPHPIKLANVPRFFISCVKNIEL